MLVFSRTMLGKSLIYQKFSQTRGTDLNEDSKFAKFALYI